MTLPGGEVARCTSCSGGGGLRLVYRQDLFMKQQNMELVQHDGLHSFSYAAVRTEKHFQTGCRKHQVPYTAASVSTLHRASQSTHAPYIYVVCLCVHTGRKFEGTGRPVDTITRCIFLKQQRSKVTHQRKRVNAPEAPISLRPSCQMLRAALYAGDGLCCVSALSAACS